MNRIRILHTLCRIHSGGVEQRRLLLAHGLRSDRYEHALICQETDGPIADALREAGWAIHEIGLAPSILSPEWHARAYAIAREFQPDIVHGAVYEGAALAASIGLRLRGVKVITEETSDPVNRRWSGNMLMYAICMSADLCLGVSPVVVSYLRNKLHLPAHKVRLLNNAVPEVAPPSVATLSALRCELGIDEGDFVIGSVGRVLDEHKRFSDLIRALPALLAKHPQVRLMIVGDGPDRATLVGLASDLGVAAAVIFAGYRGNARDFYPLMDIFALASAHEAFGLVLVEAMLAEVPIVATAVGGIPFVLDEGRCGVLVSPCTPEALGGALSELIASPSRRNLLARLGLERARSEFSAERYCREIESIYAELANRK